MDMDMDVVTIVVGRAAGKPPGNALRLLASPMARASLGW